MRKRRAWLLAIAAVLILGLTLAPAGFAFESRAGDQVVITADEVIEDDLYATAGTVRIEGTVRGDLVAMGQTIEVSGLVEGDLIAAGQSIVVSGEVGDDARLAGAVIALQEAGTIGDDLVAAGYSLETSVDSQTGGALLFAGNAALLNGSVAEQTDIAASGAELNGQFGGDVRADVGAPGDMPPFSPMSFIPGVEAAPTVAGGLTIGQQADIEGSLSYQSSQRYQVPEGAVAGQVDFNQVVQQQEEPERQQASLILQNLRKGATWLLLGLLLLLLFPSLLTESSDRLKGEPLPSLGWGVVIYAGFFVVATAITLVVALLTGFFSFITLRSLAGTSLAAGLLLLAALVIAFVLATSFLTKLIAAFFGGRWILTSINQELPGLRYWALLLGIVLLLVLTAIPFLGWLINLLVIFFGLGALFLLTREALRQPAAS